MEMKERIVLDIPKGDEAFKPKNWKFHEICENYPVMSVSEKAALRESLEVIGQQEYILMYDGLVVDGRNRILALCMLRIKPDVIDIREFSPFIKYSKAHDQLTEEQCVSNFVANYNIGKFRKNHSAYVKAFSAALDLWYGIKSSKLDEREAITQLLNSSRGTNKLIDVIAKKCQCKSVIAQYALDLAKAIYDLPDRGTIQRTKKKEYKDSILNGTKKDFIDVYSDLVGKEPKGIMPPLKHTHLALTFFEDSGWNKKELSVVTMLTKLNKEKLVELFNQIELFKL